VPSLAAGSHGLLTMVHPSLSQACRNYAKAIAAAKEQGMSEGSYTVMHLDLASLDSVRLTPLSPVAAMPFVSCSHCKPRR
jgi:hypothetical protein